MADRFDVAIAGAGIVGLAHAYHCARRGLRVVVFERQARAHGASVRNFGMLWPVGQPSGKQYELARRSVEIWCEVLSSAGLWHEKIGSLHVAYQADEAQVLREFVAQTASEGRDSRLLLPREIAERFPAIVPAGLKVGLWTPTEVVVDPREVLAGLPEWLATHFGVQFLASTSVLFYDHPRVFTSAGEWVAQRLLVCTGADFREIAPDAFARSGLMLCKLQMMRTPPQRQGFRIGSLLAAGLTLRHYRAFAACPTLPEVASRFDRENPEYGRFGIHVMASQNGLNEIVLGDSHEFGDAITPFDNPEIDQLILNYARTFVGVDDLRIAARWNGMYVKHPSEPYVISQPKLGMTAVTGLGGAGMTLSFGLAEQVVDGIWGGGHAH